MQGQAGQCHGAQYEQRCTGAWGSSHVQGTGCRGARLRRSQKIHGFQFLFRARTRPGQSWAAHAGSRPHRACNRQIARNTTFLMGHSLCTLLAALRQRWCRWRAHSDQVQAFNVSVLRAAMPASTRCSSGMRTARGACKAAGSTESSRAWPMPARRPKVGNHGRRRSRTTQGRARHPGI